MLDIGKPEGKALMAASAPGDQDSRRSLFLVADRTTGVGFLANIGAEVSVIRATAEDCRHPSTPQLRSVNEKAIPKYADCSLTLNLGLRRTFR